MRRHRFAWITGVSVLLGALLLVALTPLLTATAVRAWVQWKARQQGATVTIGGIDAPLLREVVLRDIRIVRSTPGDKVDIARATIDLNLRGLVSRSAGRCLRHLSLEGVRGLLRADRSATPENARAAWPAAHILLADKFEIAGPELRVENEFSVFQLRDFRLTADELEAGKFDARGAAINSPFFHQTFSDLRGATSWDGRRLTIGAITLTKGLDIDSVVFDFAHLAAQRLKVDVNLDAFGGKLRTSLASEQKQNRRTWSVAGTAAQISLAQMSEALGLTEHGGGAVRACTFSYRGPAGDLSAATASVWAEISGFTWADRKAETIMLGASLYNGDVQLQQLYVKQSANQLTLSGESPLKRDPGAWLSSTFRGDLSASIRDLGEFARLFGANADEFRGEGSVTGTVNARDRKLSGRLNATGDSLVVFGTPLTSANALLNLNGTELEVEQLRLERGADFLRASGKLDLAADHAYRGSLTTQIGNLADYRSLLPGMIAELGPAGGVQLDWSGDGKRERHTGRFKFHGLSLTLNSPVPLRQFDAEIEGSYTPDVLFFPRLELRGEHAAFSSYVTIAARYVQLQQIRLELNGQPKLAGDLFVPVSLRNWRSTLPSDAQLAVDLTLAQTDLAELGAAVAQEPLLTGNAEGHVQFYGGAGTFAGEANLRLRNFSVADPVHFSANVDSTLARGVMQLAATLDIAASNAINLRASIPVRIVPTGGGAAFGFDGPFSAEIDAPAVLLDKLPRFIFGELFRGGILSSRLAATDSLRHPCVTGEMQLVDGALRGGQSLAADLNFAGDHGVVQYLNFGTRDAAISAHGEIELHDATDLSARLQFDRPIVDLTSPNDYMCFHRLAIVAAPPTEIGQLHFDSAEIRGRVFSSQWSIRLGRTDSPDGLQSKVGEIYNLCGTSETGCGVITLGIAERGF